MKLQYQPALHIRNLSTTANFVCVRSGVEALDRTLRRTLFLVGSDVGGGEADLIGPLRCSIDRARQWRYGFC